jgi:Na+/H+ antiporter NhaD/arsenite permease-like protein
VLILSFAYLSISLDMSGFFKASAVYVVRMARGDGRRLLVYVYLLSSVLTYFTSNDIVIISMTPLIIHIGAHSTIHNVVPLLIAQFIAANTSSMGLLVGSPTNIILGDAMSVSFAEYWVLMLLPTAIAVVGTLLMLMVVFVWWPLRGNVMVKTFEIKTHDGVVAAAAAAAAGGGVDDLFVEGSGEEEEGLVLGALAGIAASPSRQEEGMDGDKTSEKQQQDTVQEEKKSLPPSPSSSSLKLMTSTKTRYVKVFVFFLVLILLAISSFIHMQLWVISAISAFAMLCMDLLICHRDGAHKLSYLHQVYQRMPWSIGPFVLCMFLLVRVLTKVGFTGRFAGLMIKAAGDNVWSQSLVYGYVSAILVNVLNDLPSSVLWSDALPFLCQHYSPRSFHVIVQTLLVGLNPGTYLTIIGALAGLVWKQIITSQPGSKDLKVAGAFDLTFYGVIVLAPVMLATCLSISAQSHFLVKEIHKG